MLRRFFYFVGIIFYVAVCCQVATAECPALSTDTSDRIIEYLSHRLVAGQNVRPTVKDISSLPDTCYWKVTIEMSSRSNNVVMYLSPDQRFLSSMIYDLSVDPQKEVARIAENVQKLLLRDRATLDADTGGELSIVEFGDFECPFCKQFADWYQALPESLRQKSTLIFKHLPLPQHPWAKTAAIYAACADLQAPAGFLHLSNFLLANQGRITVGNIRTQIEAELSNDKYLKLNLLTACVANGDGEKIIERDADIARQLNVIGTPTIFINGKRILPLHSSGELETVLEKELQQTSKSAELPAVQIP
jgi:protein-disulfide isomerase